MENVINYTNARLNNWYREVKESYDVVGEGVARIDGNKFIIDYIEGGESKTWVSAFYPEYLEFGLNFFFNCWMEEA